MKIRQPGAWQAWSVTWFAYATYYVGRKGFSVSKKAISDELGISTAALGAVDTAYLVAYAAGQFINGLVGDRIGARRLLGIGLFGSALACAAFGLSSGAVVFGALFFLNGIFQASGWPGTTRAMAEWTTPKNRGTIMAFWSTCYQVGGIAANAICGYLLVTYSWRSAFLGPALLLSLMGLGVLLWLKPGPGAQRDAGPADPSNSAGAMLVAPAPPTIFRSPLLWCYGASYFFMKFIRYALLFWLPFYLATTLGYAGDVAANISSSFEVGGVFGVIALGVISDRLGFASRAALSALSLLGLAGALYAYVWLSQHGIVANAIGLGLVGALLFGPDALLSGAAAQDAGGVRGAATAAGFVNGLGSIGAAVEGLVVPRLSAAWGWSSLFPALVVLAVCSALTLTPAIWWARSRSMPSV